MGRPKKPSTGLKRASELLASADPREINRNLRDGRVTRAQLSRAAKRLRDHGVPHIDDLARAIGGNPRTGGLIIPPCARVRRVVGVGGVHGDPGLTLGVGASLDASIGDDIMAVYLPGLVALLDLP